MTDPPSSAQKHKIYENTKKLMSHPNNSAPVWLILPAENTKKTELFREISVVMDEPCSCYGDIHIVCLLTGQFWCNNQKNNHSRLFPNERPLSGLFGKMIMLANLLQWISSDNMMWGINAKSMQLFASVYFLYWWQMMPPQAEGQHSISEVWKWNYLFRRPEVDLTSHIKSVESINLQSNGWSKTNDVRESVIRSHNFYKIKKTCLFLSVTKTVYYIFT